MKQKNILSVILALTMVFSMGISAFAENSSSTVINGTIQETIMEYGIPLEVTFTIDPNAENQEDSFISATGDLDNQSNAPFLVYIEKFEQTVDNPHTFEDVLPDKFTLEEWNKLGRVDSETFLALGINFLDEEGNKWRDLSQTDTLYVAQVDGITPVLIGEIDPHTTVKFILDANHGNAFKNEITTTYQVIWIFELA